MWQSLCYNVDYQFPAVASHHDASYCTRALVASPLFLGGGVIFAHIVPNAKITHCDTTAINYNHLYDRILWNHHQHEQ